MPRSRALPQRQALGRRIYAYRLALGLSARDITAHTGVGHNQVGHIEHARTDVMTGTLIDVADAVGLNVALAADHHLPLLDLTADEVDALIEAATGDLAERDYPLLRSALDKLATTEETRTNG